MQVCLAVLRLLPGWTTEKIQNPQGHGSNASPVAFFIGA